jgi:hypothetical protein
MNRTKMAKAFNILLFVWFLCIPLFWHLDLSKGAFHYAQTGTHYYDMFFMAPNAIFHLISFYALVLIYLFFNKPSVYLIFLLVLYFPFIQLVNYPFLTFRDVYLHAAPAEAILVNGKMAYPGAANASASESWPASYVLHAELSIVSGCDLISTNYLLSLALIVSFTLVLYSFAKALENKGYRIAGYGAILFLCLFFSHLFEPSHYARNPLGFTFLFLFFFAFMCFKGRRGYMLQLLIVIATVTTHPFQSFALASFTVFCAVLTHGVKRSLLAMFSAVAFVGWFMFSGSSTFLDAIDRLQTFLTPEYLTPVVETFSAKELLPWWGIILRDFFKYSLITLLIVASFAAAMIILRKRASYKNNMLPVGLVSLLFMSIVMSPALLLLPDWNVWRFTPFAAFPAAFASFILVEKIITDKKPKILLHKHKLLNSRILMSLLLLYIVTLSAAVAVLRFEGNSYFGEVNHPSELSSLSFFFTHDHNSTVNIVSWRTHIYSAYFNYNSSHQTLRLWVLEINAFAGNSSKLLFSQSQLINQSQFVIRGMRDSFTFSRLYPSEAILKVVDEEMIIPRFGLIYSNGYYSIYKRAISP